MSSWRSEEDFNEDENEDELNDEEFNTGDDKIIFLIDAREAMKEKNKKGEVHLRNCLQVMVEVIKSKIVADDKSFIGLTLFGTLHKDEAGTAEGVYTVFPLEPPSAANIRKVQEYIENGHKFTAEIGCQPKAENAFCPLREALWACSQEFHAKAAGKKSNDYRRVWLFTNDDQPNAHSITEQEKVIKVAKDCAETGIEISLWHINRQGYPPFDPKLFYRQLLLAASSPDEDDESAMLETRMRGSGDDGFDTLLANVRRKHHRKRKLRSLTMSLGLGYCPSQPQVTYIPITVNLYRLVTITKRSTHKWLYARNNQPLTVTSKFIDSETGEALDGSRISTFVDVSGARITMTSEDMLTYKQGNASSTSTTSGSVPAHADIKILFCAPHEVLRCEQNIDCPFFLFPDESATVGSASLFTAFLVELHRKGLIAFAKFATSKAVVPRLAVLVPQMETLDEDGVQVQPSGFNIIILPFMEEIRRNPSAPAEEVVASVATADDAPVAAARDLILAAQLDKNFVYYQDIESPALQQFYSVLQAVALNSDTMEWTPEQDKLHADIEGQATFAAEAEAFKQIVGLTDIDPNQPPAPKKRSAAAATASGGAAKKSKGGDGAGAGDVGDLGAKSLAELKELCKAHKLPVSGTKAALIERLSEVVGL